MVTTIRSRAKWDIEGSMISLRERRNTGELDVGDENRDVVISRSGYLYQGRDGDLKGFLMNWISSFNLFPFFGSGCRIPPWTFSEYTHPSLDRLQIDQPHCCAEKVKVNSHP